MMRIMRRVTPRIILLQSFKLIAFVVIVRWIIVQVLSKQTSRNNSQSDATKNILAVQSSDNNLADHTHSKDMNKSLTITNLGALSGTKQSVAENLLKPNIHTNESLNPPKVPETHQAMDLGGLDPICALSMKERTLNHNDAPNYLNLYIKTYLKKGFHLQPGCTVKPWPQLSFIPPNTNSDAYCKSIFETWLDANSNKEKQPESTIHSVKPEDITPEQKEQMTLGGLLSFNQYYVDLNITTKPQFKWDDKIIDYAIKDAEQRKNVTYDHPTAALYAAVERLNSVGKKGLSDNGNGYSAFMEGILLGVGKLSQLTVMSSENIEVKYPGIAGLHSIDVAKNYLKDPATFGNYDVIASYGKIHQAGLGRDGPPLDPNGDLTEMQKAWCLLNPGGMVVVEADHSLEEIIYNLGRLYGPIRFPLLTAGFEVVEVYGDKATPMEWRNLPEDRWIFGPYEEEAKHPILVLRKILPK